MIHILKKHFSTRGIPNKLMSNNGSPYSSYEFQQFVTSYDIEHVTSSPHYLQIAKRQDSQTSFKEIQGSWIRFLTSFVSMEKYTY